MERHMGDPLMGKLHPPRGATFLYHASENCGGVGYLDKIWTIHVFLSFVFLLRWISTSAKVLCFHIILKFCFQSQIVTPHQIFFIYFEFWGRWHRAAVRRVGAGVNGQCPKLISCATRNNASTDCCQLMR